MEKMAIFVSAETHKRIKVRAAKEDTTMMDLIEKWSLEHENHE
jgi:hypothetical protein